MSAGQQANSTQQTPTWTEPPWSGWIETTGDALLILEAARRGLIPRVTRRLVDSERKMITSGSVFVFDEDESGIKRWTDGFFWSPSRILGNFLLYRETDKRGSSRGKDGDNGDGIDKPENHSLSRPKSDPIHPNVDKHRERILVGSLTNSYKFKPDGLMKKTFSLTIGGVAQHLISYYKIEDVESGRLRPPSSLPELASLEISAEYLDKTHFRNPPKVELCTDGVLRYRGEADDIDPPSPLLTGPLTGLPLLTEGHVTTEPNGSKRNKRYEPYNVSSTVPSKRPRKSTKALSASDSQQSLTQFQSQSPPTQDVVNAPIANSSTTETQAQTQTQTQTPPDQNTSSLTPVVSPTATSTPVSPPAPPAGSYPTYGMHPYYQMPGYIQPPPHVGMGVGMYPHQAAYSTVSPTQPMHHAPPAPYAYAGYAMPALAPAPGLDSHMSGQPSINGQVQHQQQQVQQMPVQPPVPGYYPHPLPSLPHPQHPPTYYAPAPPLAPSTIHGAQAAHPGHPPPPPPPQMYSPYPPPPPHPHAAPMWPHPHAHISQSSPPGPHPQAPQPPPTVQHSHPHPHYTAYPPPPPQMQMQVQMSMQHPQYSYPHPHPNSHIPAPMVYPPGQPQQQLAMQPQPQQQGQEQGQLQEPAQEHSQRAETRVVDSVHQEKQHGGVGGSANVDGMEVGEGNGKVRSGRESE